MNWVRTGRHLAPEQVRELKKLVEYARSAPVMTVRSDLPDFATSAWQRVQQFVDEAGRGHGFPDGTGIDPETGEFMTPGAA